MHRLACALLAATALSAAPALAQSNGSVVTDPPNVPSQEPAFENQTRAPQPEAAANVTTETIVDALPNLWAMEFLPDGRMLVTTKAGALHIITQDGTVGDAITGAPAVDSRGQGGLLDVALSPDFETSNTIYLSYAEPRGNDENGTSVAKGALILDDNNSGTLEDTVVVFQQMPSYAGTKHFGSRLVFADNGDLFVAVGERSDTPIRDQAQDLTSGLGKVFRITANGGAAEGNPFLDHAALQPEIWSYGHRNIQSATLDGEGNLWTVEHGPQGGDELNMPEKGKNYGWPAITYGENYDGTPVGNGLTKLEGMEQPVYYWDPVIAPSGMAYYDSDLIPEWQGAFLIGGLRNQGVVVIHMEDGRVASEARVPVGQRVQDVKVGPDGAVYAVTEASNDGASTIVRIHPAD